MQRRQALCLAAGMAALALAPSALAAPTVTMQAHIGAVPKNLLKPKGASWPHTGAAGQGAELTASFTIRGSEQGGLPAPLRQVLVWLPQGAVVHTSGFARCHSGPANWHKTGDAPTCPARSFAGAATEAFDLADYSGTDVPEPIRQGALFVASGELRFWILGLGGWLGLQGGAPGSLKLDGSHYQLVENLPVIEAPGANLQPQAITIAIGAAYQQGHSLVSLLTLPKSCPAGGYPVKATLSFGEGTEATWTRVSTAALLACHAGGSK
jgi:hypothetical protein